MSKKNVISKILKSVPLETRIKTSIQAHFFAEHGGSFFIPASEEGEEYEKIMAANAKCMEMAQPLIDSVLDDIKEWKKDGYPEPNQTQEKHPTEIKPFTIKELAEKVGDLRYDQLSLFIELLAEKIDDDAMKDRMGGRKKLASQLVSVADSLFKATEYTDKAWEICEPYIKKGK